MNEELKVIENAQITLAEAEKGQFDVQISTAKRYPRDIKRSLNNSIAIATMSEETAKSCGYALPRGGKTITGASVHLARILAQNWGNLRVEAKVVAILEKEVVSNAVCFDLESNYAVKVEVRKKITYSHGGRYNDDLITLMGNVANAIAYRNSVFSVIPKSVTDSVYTETRNMLAGDVSTEAKLIKKRNSALEYFKDKYGATEPELLQVLKIGSVNAIKRDELILLLGFDQAIKDGDTTPDELFGRIKTKKVIEEPESLKDAPLKKDPEKDQ